MQKDFLIENSVAATLTMPDNCLKPVPAILCLHGFGTNKEEVGGFFTLLSQSLLEQNIGCLSIDFRGFGQSKGTTAELTIDRMVEDAKLALAYLLNVPEIDKSKIGLCGFSLGAGISILIAGASIKSMALLSPAGDLVNDFLTYLGAEDFNKVKTAINPIEIDLGWRSIHLARNFIQSLIGVDLNERFSSYHGSFFVMAGEEDFTAKHAILYDKCAKSTTSEIILVKNADHIFNMKNSTESLLPEVNNKVTSWFQSTL